MNESLDGKCPRRWELAGLLPASSNDTEWRQLLTHLAECPACRSEFCLQLECGGWEGLDSRADEPLLADDPSPLPVERMRAIERKIEGELRLPERQLVAQAVFARLELLGRGGLGEVHRYRDRHLQRDVAVKFLHEAGAQDPELRARFERECQLTAFLNHPAIVPVHGRGECDDGRPFYVMACVDGQSLRQRIRDAHAAGDLQLRRNNDPFRTLLAAFLSTCGAIEHAHRQGVLHRDLKPDNIMVRDDGVTMVVDWGLSKSGGNTRPDATTEQRRAADLTSAQVMGTPAYMAPEQLAPEQLTPEQLTPEQLAPGQVTPEGLASEQPAREQRASGKLVAEQLVAGEPEGGGYDPVTERTDVHCLGAVLYEILTGAAPRQLDSRLTREEQLRTLRRRLAVEDEPWDVQRLDDVPPELASICRRAMAKRPERRYASARELAADVDRWLVGDRVRAHGYTVAQRLSRQARRRAGVLATISLALLILMVLAAASLAVVRQSRDREQQARRDAENALQREEMRRLQAVGQLSKSALDSGDLMNVLGDTSSPHASWPEHYLRLIASQRPELLAAYGDGYSGMVCLDVSPDQRQVLCGDACGRLALWELESGQLQRVLEPGRFDAGKRGGLHVLVPADGDDPQAPETAWTPCFVSVRWLGQSRQVAAASLDGQGVLIDLDSGQRRTLIDAEEALTVVATDEAATRLLFGGQSGGLYLVDRDGQRVAETVPNRDPVTDARKLGTLGWVVGRESGTLEWRAGDDLQLRAQLALPGPVWGLAVIERDSLWEIAVAAGEGQVRVFEVTDPSDGPRLRYRLRAPLSQQRSVQYHALRYSPRGRTLYAVDSAGVLVAWEGAEQRVRWTRDAVGHNHGQQALVRLALESGRSVPLCLRRRASGLRLVRDARILLAAGEDLAVKAWQLPAESREGRHLAQDTLGPRPCIAFDRERPGILWTRDVPGTISVLDARTGQTLARRANAHPAQVANLVLLGPLAITAGDDGQVRFWSYRDGAIVPDSRYEPLVNPHSLRGIAVDPQGHWLAATDVTNRLVLWRMSDRKRLERRLADDSTVPPLTGRLAFSPDGRHLAVFAGGQRAPVFRFDPESEELTAMGPQLDVANRGGTALIWNPAWPLHVLAADDYPRVVQKWGGAQPESWTPRPFAEHIVTAMDVTSDGKRLVLLEHDGLIRFLDCRTGLEINRLQAAFSGAWDLAFDSGKRWMAVASEDGRIEFWDAVGQDRPTASAGNWEDDRDSWQSSRLGSSGPARLVADSRCVRLDKQDRVALLAVRCYYPESGQGQAVLYRDGTPRVVGEPLMSPGGHDDRVPHAGLGLAFGANGEPIAAVRRSIGSENSYDGTFGLAWRQPEGRWEWQTLRNHTNDGFFPVIHVDQRGHVAEVLHFSFHGYYLLRSAPGSAGSWTTQKIGLQGDGLGLEGRRDSAGNLHLLFDLNRMNDSPPMLTHAVWSAERGKLDRQTVSASQLGWPNCFGLLPGGQPVTVVQAYDWQSEIRQLQLVKRTEHGWRLHQVLPPDSKPLGDIEITSQGTACWLQYHPEQQVLTLRWGREDRWLERVIAHDVTSPPAAAYLRFDSRNRPVVITLNRDKGETVIDVLRRTAPLPRIPDAR